MFDPSPLPLTLDEPQRTALAAAGVHAPNALQCAAWEPVASEAPVVLHAATGTGKTLAYLFPALQRLRDTPGLRAVVMAPGTELVMQIQRVARSVAPADLPIAVAAATTNRRRQKKRVVQSTRLILGTPDRIAELFAKKKLKNVGLLVIDELDPVLANPVSSFLESWLVRSEPKLQTLVASATLGRRSEAFLTRFLPDAVRLRPEVTSVVATVHHRLVVVQGPSRDVALARFVEAHKVRRGVVFCADPRVLSHLQRYLEEHGLSAVTVQRGGSKQARKQGLQRFRSGEVRLLLTTDAVARGLDVPNVDWVLHYDLPAHPDAYVHRAGRTGRAGREGTSVVFADHGMLEGVRRLGKTLRIRFATD